MERVLLTRGVRLGVVSRPKHDVLDEASIDVRVLEERLWEHPLGVGAHSNVISVG